VGLRASPSKRKTNAKPSRERCLVAQMELEERAAAKALAVAKMSRADSETNASTNAMRSIAGPTINREDKDQDQKTRRFQKTASERGFYSATV